MDQVKEFVLKCIDYLKANPMYAIILAAAAVVVVVLLIVIISLSAKRSKAKKAQKKLAAEEAAKAQQLAAQKAAAEKAEADKKKKEEAEAKRQATLARLEAERLAAEKAEADRIAAEEAAKKAEEDRVAAEEAAKKAEEDRVAAEMATAEKSKVVEEPVEVKEEETETIATKSKKATKKEEKPVLYDELKDAEEEDAIWYDENETDKAARYNGKWLISKVVTSDHSEEEMYFFELHASNGEKLLTSEEYTSYNGALRGIETHKTNILKGNFKITLSKKGDYIFKLLSGKNMLLCMGENYPTKARCESAIESAKRFAKTAVIDENVQDYIVKVPAEDDAEPAPIPENSNGKWIISKNVNSENEEVFYFELFANNGEKLLSSEEYTTYIGAVNGIQTHKTNIQKGNFRISLTKRGDYIYKLLNGNGQLLCLGEHYKTKRLCQNAVESVKRFALNSPLLTDPEHKK